MPTIITFEGRNTQKTFLDSCIVYKGLPTLTITGLDHLNGMAVGVLADGAAHPNKTVANGSITLDFEARIVHVGLPYDSIIQPMRLDMDAGAGNTQGAVKSIRGVSLRLMDTLGLKIANEEGGVFRKVQFRTTTDVMDSPPELFTGEKYYAIDSNHDEDATIILKQDQPLPWTLIGMVVHYQVTGIQ